MSSISSETKPRRSGTKPKYSYIKIGLTIFLTCILACILVWIIFHWVTASQPNENTGNMETDWERRGVIGDSIAPLTALLTALALWTTVHSVGLQRTELELQRKELQGSRKALQEQAKAQQQLRRAYLYHARAALLIHQNQLEKEKNQGKSRSSGATKAEISLANELYCLERDINNEIEQLNNDSQNPPLEGKE